MDIKIVDNQGVEEVPEVREAKEPGETTNYDDLLITSVGQLFDMKPSEMGAMKDKIQLLIDYARTQTEETSPESIKWAIRSLQGKVGTPPLGEKWINYLSKYCYLKLEGLKLKAETENYERNV
jgi:hypothetical protein